MAKEPMAMSPAATWPRGDPVPTSTAPSCPYTELTHRCFVLRRGFSAPVLTPPFCLPSSLPSAPVVPTHPSCHSRGLGTATPVATVLGRGQPDRAVMETGGRTPGPRCHHAQGTTGDTWWQGWGQPWVAHTDRHPTMHPPRRDTVTNQQTDQGDTHTTAGGTLVAQPQQSHNACHETPTDTPSTRQRGHVGGDLGTMGTEAHPHTHVPAGWHRGGPESPR